MHAERRVLRSNSPTDAVRMFLACNATEPGIRAAVVSDDAGFLLGGVGGGDLEVLAAVGSLLSDGHRMDDAQLCGSFGLSRDQIHTQRIGVGTQTFVVTSIGARLSAAPQVGEMLDRLLS